MNNKKDNLLFLSSLPELKKLKFTTKNIVPGIMSIDDLYLNDHYVGTMVRKNNYYSIVYNVKSLGYFLKLKMI